MKYKLLIIDDEPLVQVGIKSMVDWASLDIEICATAVNGSVGLGLIESLQPDIVLTDIKMPVMDGLSMLRSYRESSDNMLPVFIMLTSFEEFDLAREAISLRAFDYLVKVELTGEKLVSTIKRATEEIDKIKSVRDTTSEAGNNKGTQASLRRFTEKFMISLLNNLFESRDQLLLQAEDLHLSFDYKNYICCYGSFESSPASSPATGIFALYDSALNMVKELSEKFQPCYTISLDISHFALIFCYKEEVVVSDIELLSDMLIRICGSLMNYMGVKMRCGIGLIVNDLLNICGSYQHSRLSYGQTDDRQLVVYAQPSSVRSHDTFHFSLFQKELTRAYEEYNSDLLRDNINLLSELLLAHPERFAQALDAASNILYMSISLLPDGEAVINDFFLEEADGYLSLYRQGSTPRIIDWLEELTDKICDFFDAKKKDYKNKIVSDVKLYIAEHVREKLTLNEVAAQFGISPSYLSQLFSRYNEAGFSEYINICKIEAAKRMLKEENSRVYEVADALSFGSEFYFSKVFKKVEGISPSEYVNS